MIHLHNDTHRHRHTQPHAHTQTEKCRELLIKDNGLGMVARAMKIIHFSKQSLIDRNRMILATIKVLSKWHQTNHPLLLLLLFSPTPLSSLLFFFAFSFLNGCPIP